MPFATGAILGLVGAAAGIAGTATQIIGQQEARAAQQKAENSRQLQMNLDSARNQRDIARKAILAQSTALTNATNQGAQFSSGLQGGLAQIAGQAGDASQTTTQNNLLGNNMFRYNAQASIGQGLGAFGQSIAGVGGQIYQNRDMLGRVGSYITGNDTWG